MTTAKLGDSLDGLNVPVAQDPAGNLKPAKDKSTERTDGIVALILALGRAMLPGEPTFAPFARLAQRLAGEVTTLATS
jgi:hypothetical protein